ncbi:MAG: class III signal peptide-containing protein [Methanobrevibacter sp. CfCl-M3]
MKHYLNELKIDQKGQAGAELILLIGAMLIIVLMVVYFYKNYLGDLKNEISDNELDELNKSIEAISSKFINK